MKKRNAKVFALFMSVAMAMPNVAAAMPVYAAPEFEDEADFGDKFEEEFEAEAEEEVEAEDTTDADDEFVEETEDVEVVTAARGDCGDPISGDVKDVQWELDKNGELHISANGTDAHMADYQDVDGSRAPWYGVKDQIKTVRITGDLYNIGDFAFEDCDSLTDVELTTTIEIVGMGAFEDCKSLKVVTFDDPDRISITEYREGAFYNCTALEQMDFSQKVRRINDFTFYNCQKYKPGSMLEFPDTLTYIGVAAFWNCQSIEQVRIPYSVMVINGDYDGNKYNSTDDATNVDGIEGKWGAFTGCTGLKQVELVASTVMVGGVAQLQGIRYIGDFAFYGCTSLGSIKLPATMMELGDFAFADCTGMTDATIEDSELERIYGAFEECTSLTTVTFGTYDSREYLDKDNDGILDVYTGYWSGIREIGNRSFNGCSSLTDVVLTPELFNWKYELNIPKRLAITADDMTIINEEAFRSCEKLTHFDFPTDTLRVMDNAFRDCSRLNHVVLAETTEELGRNAFYNDTAMEDFYIPAAMQSIGGECFDCRQGVAAMKLMDLYYGGTEGDWNYLADNGIVQDRTNNGFSNSIIVSGAEARYKATRYYNTNPTFPVSSNVDVVYDDGSMHISWDAVTMTTVDATGKEVTVSPTRYEVYQNNVNSTNIDGQWTSITPSWNRIGRPTTNSLTYAINNVVPGDIYNYRVLAVFGNQAGYLTAYKEYVVPSAEDEVKITNLEFEQETQEVRVDKTVDLALKVTPEAASTKDISWSSSDSTIASVATSEDKTTAQVTGNATGTVTITAKTSDGVVATCNVTVVSKNAVSVEKISFEQKKLTVAVEGKGDLSVKVSPENYDPTNFIWESSNEKIATVVSTGDKTTATVTGVKEGTAEITVTSANGTTATIKVTVSGQANPAKTGTRYIDGKVYKDGVVQENYTGLALNGAGETAPWIYIENDKENKEFEGYVNFNGGKFYVKDGVLDTTANGVKADWTQDPVVFYFCANGQVQTQHVGLAEYDGEWFYITDGKVQTEMNKFVEYDGGLFAVAAGRIVSEYSGLMQDPTNAQTGAWYFFANGQAQTQYTGLAEYDGHWFYVQGGKFDPAYNGSVVWNGATFNVVNGEAQVK